MSCIAEGFGVILKKDSSYKFEVIKKGSHIKFEGAKFTLDNAIGHAFNKQFLISKGSLIPQQKNQIESKIVTQEENRDNRKLFASENNQSLKADDIESLRNDGVSGTDIIQKLVDSSSTFATKTVFSQQKYMKKKCKKHVDVITILKPTTRVLCEMYSQKGKLKTLGLRIDTLSLMLSHANVHSGCKVLLSETCCGLLLGSVMERLGPEGRVAHVFHGSAPLRPEMHWLPCPDNDPASPQSRNWWRNRVMEIPLQDVVPLLLNGPAFDCKQVVETEEAIVPPEELEDSSELPTQSKRRKIDDLEKTSEKMNMKMCARQFLHSAEFDCLLIATRFDPSNLAITLLNFLNIGKPFVVYSQFMEPLVELYAKLKTRGGSGHLHITETWLRSYQVLPERTHPAINMSGHGGYLLTGFKIDFTKEEIKDDADHPLIQDYRSGLLTLSADKCVK